MPYETILYTVQDGIATIALNRTDKLNAFNDQMITETKKALKDSGRDDAVRCIILTGSGRAFSAGQDLADVQGRGEAFSIGEHLRHGYNELIMQMVNLEKPIIGAINGVAAGAGCSVALATDIRIASDKASFMQAFSRVGLIPDSGANWVLPRLVGYNRAYQMAITAEKVTAEKALDWGLVNMVVPHDQLAETVQAWALKLAAGPTRAFGLTKRAMRQSENMSLAETLAYESYLQEAAGRTEDNKEGVMAFLEKREPQFKGK
ncbi:MAG: enoyl-CoA hydratase/isomerase family protein [Chloroflexi bacterium]|nr:enoyl-CoA hydratase/isomerase family protein [Chloroflexota bacterium]MBP8058527.1 enoyl-CoA hydratase/isomerase family protein [Chloroflexota bacterium]